MARRSEIGDLGLAESMPTNTEITIKLEALPINSGKCSYADSLNAQKITDSWKDSNYQIPSNPQSNP
jgi:hypothetical protein